MKRQAITLAQLADRQNLLLATWKAVRGKRHRPAVQAWLADLDERLADLSQRVLDGRVPVAGLRRFAICDPKPREKSVHSLADRVLHHAILNLAEPRFEQMLVPSSFACRPGLGVHAAVRAAQGHLQRFGWWVQVDVAAYFAHIDHAILMDLLHRRFKGAAFLALLQRIVAHGALADEDAKGLPIGALTSQHFANAYLDGADRFLLQHPQVRAHVRYMDDTVWWCESAQAGQRTLAALTEHLWRTRRLHLKQPVRQGPSRQGLKFCGFRVRQGVVLPSARKLARYRQGAQALVGAERAGHPQALLQRAHEGLAATLAHAQSLHFRRGVWAPPGFDPESP